MTTKPPTIHKAQGAQGADLLAALHIARAWVQKELPCGVDWDDLGPWSDSKNRESANGLLQNAEELCALLSRAIHKAQGATEGGAE